ncbi:MAG: tetratricopeptide repeat protein [Pseudomonadota bacterium]
MITRVLTAAAMMLLGTALMVPVSAQTVAGSYLAGRHAAVNSDYREAARYYQNALAHDPANVELLESTVLALLSLGKVDRAAPLARILQERSANSQVARMVITAENANKEDYRAILAQASDTTGIGPWVDGLIKAWSQVGAGDVTAAMAAFDTLAEEAGLQGFVRYHRALALASVGDYEGAEAIFATAAAGAAGQTRRGVMAHAEVLAQLERHEDALTVLQASFGDATDPELDRMIARLEAKEAVAFTHAPDAKAGIAEIYFTFAAVLNAEDAGDYYVLLYARAARYLRPDHIDALLLTAELLEDLGQNDLASLEYKQVPADNPAFHVAELGRAGALRAADKEAQAVEVLEQLARTHGDLAVVHSTLGDVLRGAESYGPAIEAYDRALGLAAENAPVRWVLYYSRGIAHERSGNELEMEADFRAALALRPEQPQVLNYLGYSMVEQKRNLDEALDMIERAVAASPDSGYIVDSLGWVLYRLGRYEEAVVHMERAVELLPADPVVNDHLGDVYWAVGRAREAEFQWRRALSFLDNEDASPDVQPERIRRKLEIGLDAVLNEEGAPPLQVAEEL